MARVFCHILSFLTEKIVFVITELAFDFLWALPAFVVGKSTPEKHEDTHCNQILIMSCHVMIFIKFSNFDHVISCYVMIFIEFLMCLC